MHLLVIMFKLILRSRVMPVLLHGCSCSYLSAIARPLFLSLLANHFLNGVFVHDDNNLFLRHKIALGL